MSGQEGGIEGGGAAFAQRLGLSVVDAVRVMQPIPERRCLVFYQAKNARQWARASSTLPNRAGKSGWYFIILNCDSEYGLSSET